MKNKYSKEFEEDMYRLATNMSLDDLLEVAKSKYHYNITKKCLQLYCSKRKIRYKDYCENKSHHSLGNKIPIGSEYKRPDGMVFVKVAKDKWIYKQRLVYENYYNVKLDENDFIIFLDGNRNNYDINNLKRVSRRESAVMINNGLFFNEPELTETGSTVAQLMIKTKDKEKEAE